MRRVLVLSERPTPEVLPALDAIGADVKTDSPTADALARLPDAQREAVTLQYWHGRSLNEIAAHMGRTPAAVAGLLKRGLKQLRQALRPGA